MTVSSGSFTQTGANSSGTQVIASLNVSGGTCSWDSGGAGGYLTVTSSITESGGSLSFGQKTAGATLLNITAGTLGLGTSTISLSSAPNVISPASCTDGGSIINLNAAGNLELNTGISSTVGTINVNKSTTLVSTSGGASGVATSIVIASSYYLFLNANLGALSLYLGSSSAAGSLTATGYLEVADSTNTVTLSAISPTSYPFTYTGSDIVYNGLAITIDGISAASLASSLAASSSLSLGGVNSFGSITLAASSSLSFAASETLACGDLTANTGSYVLNAGANTLTSSGSVKILGGSGSGYFTNPTNSTLILTGSTKTLTATPQLGNISVSGSITLGSALSLAGTMTISGTLDVSTSNYTITSAGSTWTNTGTFVPESGTVSFTASAVAINGNNAWYVFDCETAGATISFAQNAAQSVASVFRVKSSSSSSYITITRQGSVGDLNWTIGNAPTASIMWQLDLATSASLDMQYVYVSYSDARYRPLAVPSNVTLMYYDGSGGLSSTLVSPSDTSKTYLTDYQWISGLPVAYSYTEDPNGTGKIDRIRVVCAANVNGDFSGFTASVTGYTVDTSLGTNGYAMVPSASCLPSSGSPVYGGYGKEFWIYLKELSSNDTGATPDWSISKNTSLLDASTGKYKLTTLYGSYTTALDGSKPRIAYTLALPGHNQVFFHFSEPVYASDGTSAIDASYFSGATSISRITTSGNGTSECLVTYSSAQTAAAIAADSTISVSTSISNKIQSPTDYSAVLSWSTFFFNTYNVYPPAPYNEAAGYSAATPAWTTVATLASVPYYRYYPTSYASTEALGYQHRISDVMISLPPQNGTTFNNDWFFAWPIYAKDNTTLTLTDAQIAQLTAAQSAAEGIGLIRAFDGSQWLRPQNITIQTKMSSDLASSISPSLAYDVNVASSYVGPYGSWLPSHAESDYSGFDTYPETGASIYGSSGSALGTPSLISSANALWDITIGSSDTKIAGQADDSVVNFFYVLSGSASTQYGARLAVPDPSNVPTDWYKYVRPFAFRLHKVVSQKGGVSIFNNVIDPTKGETVRLEYQLASAGSVTVTVFTLDGDVVQRLVNTSSQAAGDYSVYWNGRNLAGMAVARGLYFVRVVAPGMDEIRKVLVVRK